MQHKSMVTQEHVLSKKPMGYVNKDPFVSLFMNKKRILTGAPGTDKV